MSILNIFKRKANKQATAQPNFITDYFPLSNRLSENDSTAFACIDRIATEMALLNFGIFETKTKKKLKKHPLYAVLKQPSLDEGHFNFFYQSVIDYFNGGCFWFKVKNFDKVVSLFRLDSKSVTISRDSVTNERKFSYNGKTFSSDEIIYIPSRYGYSTLYGGKSIFSAARETFDTATSLEAFTQSAFMNGVIGNRLVINIEKAFPDATKEQLKALKDSFQSEYAGANNAGRPLVELKGIEYKGVQLGTINNQAAELFENRKFQEHEIAKLFGVPESLLTVSKDSGSGNLENSFTLFSEFAIRPIATQFSEAINSMLDEDIAYFDFDYNGIMKVSMSQRMSAYKDQFLNGWASINEIRARENLEPIEAGDYHFIAVNLMPLLESNIEAYMAKQKLALQQLQNGNTTPASDTNTDEGDIDSGDSKTDGSHFAGGDDKQ